MTHHLFAKQKKGVVLGIAALSAFALLLLLAAAASQVGKAPQASAPVTTGGTPSAEGYETFSALSGDHRGTWNNATFGTSGTIAMSTDILPDGSASGTLDLGGSVFGLLDPDPMELTGSYSTARLTFAGSDSFFGTLTMNVDADGDVVVSAPDFTVPGIDRL